MTPREIVLAAIRFENPPYVPWDVGFTVKPAEKLKRHFGSEDLRPFIRNHIVELKSPTRDFLEEAPGMFRDAYGVLWDRTIDRDIGTPCEYPLHGPTLKSYSFPPIHPQRERHQELIASLPGFAVRFSIGFSLFERAWTLRGMENLLMDFVERPRFVHELLDAICEHNLQLIQWGLQLNPDIVHFGDDWGQQHGLIMGPRHWREFIKPRIKRMYTAVREAGKVVSIHSCGDVDELFDDLVELGLNLFNPFQPEVMDVYALKRKYHGRLAFHGGLSTQRVLPFGTPEEVRAEAHRLIREIGRGGGYIFAPAHAVPGDVPRENILAFMEVLQSQPGFRGMAWPA
jgi:uroporphyrinogen decarboxylase